MRKYTWLESNRIQQKLVRGLRTRLQKFESTAGQNYVETQQEIETLAGQYDRKIAATHQQQHQEQAAAFTSWDDEIDAAWRMMEAGSFGSLQRQEKLLAQLLTDVRSKREHQVKEHTSSRAKLVKEYESVRKHPGKRLEQRTTELQQLLSRSQEQVSLSQQLLRSRHVKTPQTPSEKPVIDPQPLKELYGLLQATNQELTDTCKRMQSHPAIVWGESSRMLPLALLASIAGIGGLWQFYEPMIAILGGIGIGVGFLGFGWLILRPFVTSALRRLFPQSQQQLSKLEVAAVQARKLLEQECQSESLRIKTEYESKLHDLDHKHEQVLQQLQDHLDQESARIRTTERNTRQQMATLHGESLNGLQKKLQPKFDELLAIHHAQQVELEASHRRNIQDRRRAFLDGLKFLEKRLSEGQQAAVRVQETLEARWKQSFPAWDQSEAWHQARLARDNELAVLPLGTMHVHLDPPVTAENVETSLPKEPFDVDIPLHYQLIEDGSLILESKDALGRRFAQETVRNLLMRALTSLPAAGFQVTVIDPDGLGRDYSWLMHLADSDPKIVNYRVWTQASHIAEQLTKLSHHTEDVIQQLLRDTYADIRAYNREAGTMAEPYRLVVWSRFPTGLDDNAWRMLCSLMASGGRCGVGVILLLDESLPWPALADASRLQEAGLWLQMPVEGGDNLAKIVGSALAPFPVELALPPGEELQSLLLDKCAKEALEGGKVEVPFSTIMPVDTPQGSLKSADGLTIPLGQAGVGRTQHMRLGLGTAQHVLIAGKTGSGKSSLLHTMITSAAIEYAPDQLRLVLLDFKKGVEFQVYAETMIPHADIIGIESQREFGLSTLEYLDRVMQRRGELFREAGVQNVAGWMEKHPDRPMPRILTVIDEFQELFVEDDKLGQQASMLLDRIVRQGRSFGMHVVLASQTLGGAYSLPRTTLAQMAVRIALQCEGSDAMIILSEDNLAAERLRHAGQAVYNDASGRVEGNQPFQVAYLHSKEQEARLRSIQSHHRERMMHYDGLDKCIVFEGHRPAVWSPNAMSESLRLGATQDANLLRSVVGDSVSIEPSVMVPWTRQAGRNLLMVGGDDRNAADCLAAIITSACYCAKHQLSQTVQLAWLDGSRPDDRFTSLLPKLALRLDPQAKLGDPRSVDQVVTYVYEQMQSRQQDLEVKHPPLILTIAQLSRFRDLRKSDEYSFGSDDGPPSLDKQLETILRDGPGVGIHTILWADNYNTVSRALSRQSLHDLELKVLMQMSANDSNHLIDSPVANRLDSHVLMLHDEATGIGRKFRPYRLDDFQALQDWIG